MNTDNIRSIIAFAIGKEQEAADFYTGLAARVKSAAVVEELRRMAQMELGHKARLENINAERLASSEAVEVRDLKIADYTVSALPGPDMTWPDIVNIAMHRELAAANLYGDLAAIVDDAAVKRLFENLAAEEKRHKLYLETIWDQDIMKEN